MSTTPRIGDSISRTDGILKVTGNAPYAAEHFPSGMLYGWIVSSGIAKGRIKAIDDSRARSIAGVVEIITHKNRPHMAFLDGAVGQGTNDFKIELARRAIARALAQAVAGTPQSHTDKRIQ